MRPRRRAALAVALSSLALSLARESAAALPDASLGRVLACYWGLDRATDLTYESFKANVLRPLQADLCGVISTRHSDGSGAWRRDAAYLELVDEPESFATLASPRALEIHNQASFSFHLLAVRALRTIHQSDTWYIREDNWLLPSGVPSMLSKSLLWALIEREGLALKYEWFFLCRTDLLWLAPVFDFRHDDTHSVWVPWAGPTNEWGGYYDRAAGVHRSHARAVLTMLDVATNASHPLLDALQPYPGTVGLSTNCACEGPEPSESPARRLMRLRTLPLLARGPLPLQASTFTSSI